jgi:hypothetical protein
MTVPDLKTCDMDTFEQFINRASAYTLWLVRHDILERVKRLESERPTVKFGIMGVSEDYG